VPIEIEDERIEAGLEELIIDAEARLIALERSDRRVPHRPGFAILTVLAVGVGRRCAMKARRAGCQGTLKGGLLLA
jgi:hypothetical protein